MIAWTRVMAYRMAAIGLAACWATGCTVEDGSSAPECKEGAGETCQRSDELQDCVCPAIYAPVCGQDGKTYGNGCEAGCAQVPVAYEGECTPAEDAGPACICAEIYKPVCGKDGKTYGNACEAGCAGVPVAYEGECKPEPDAGPGCICPAIYKPVCGKDGKTYGNVCELDCANVPFAYDGECTDAGCEGTACKSNADCSGGTICYPPTKQCQPACEIACLVYEPVCGRDGITYGCGAADANCHGVEVAYPGECASANTCDSDDDCPHGHCDRGVTCAAIGCPPPPPGKCTVCGDGSQALCLALPAPCPDGQVREVVNSCFGECVDPYTCKSAGGGCTYDGKTYQPGDSFPANDGCNTCGCSEDGSVYCTLIACACDYSAPGRKWVARSADECATVRFTCAEGQPFFDDCGCGCETKPVTCKVGGCSGQLCVGPGDPDVSTCEWRDEYACYKDATCEVQADGRCGWTPTDELKLCIEDARQ